MCVVKVLVISKVYIFNTSYVFFIELIVGVLVNAHVK